MRGGSICEACPERCVQDPRLLRTASTVGTLPSMVGCYGTPAYMSLQAEWRPCSPKQDTMPRHVSASVNKAGLVQGMSLEGCVSVSLLSAR